MSEGPQLRVLALLMHGTPCWTGALTQLKSLLIRHVVRGDKKGAARKQAPAEEGVVALGSATTGPPTSSARNPAVAPR